LESAPRRDDPDLSVPTFAFFAPLVDGVRVAGRIEARAGWPVWDGHGPAPGAPMPPELETLAASVTDRLQTADGLRTPTSPAPNAFTSVYVDRYPAGGKFVAHTDRDIYGPVVAGVSIGPGSCTLTFLFEGKPVFEHELRPRSLYAFAGRLRAAPCLHQVTGVSDVRFAISFRYAATGHGDCVQ